MPAANRLAPGHLQQAAWPAGKTWTMLGPPGALAAMAPEARGVIPRAFAALLAALAAPGRFAQWSLAVTYVEVYCEAIYDLLAPDAGKARDKQGSSGAAVDVYEAGGAMHLKGVEPTPVRSMQACSLPARLGWRAGTIVPVPLAGSSAVCDAGGVLPAVHHQSKLSQRARTACARGLTGVALN
jgi:Kinesin motor domain